jgi:SAM-dependent methyltransferase
VKRVKKNFECPNCNNNDFTVYDKYYHGRRIGIKKILICNFCKLKQTDKLPSNEKLKSFYNNINTRRLFDYSKEVALDKYFNEFDSYLKFIIDKAKLNIKDKLNIIDIGAGNGRTLLQINELTSWNSLGIEPDKTKCRVLNFLKLNFINDIFQNVNKDLKNDHYDLIIVSQALEHIENPVDLLKELNNKLKKNGYLWVDVPHCDDNYFNSRTDDSLGHLYFFNKTTLSEILKKCNYQPVSSGTYGKKSEIKRTMFSSIKLFFKYYLHRFLPMFILNINRLISQKNQKVKKDNLKVVYENDKIEINENNYDYKKLFMIVKKS